MILNYKTELIQVEVIKSKRKTLCMSLKENGTVVVKAPVFLDDEKIRDIVLNKGDWILTKRKEIQTIQKRKIERDYLNGSTILYLGRELPIEIIKASKNHISLYNDKIRVETVHDDTEYMKQILKKWYKKESKEYITARVSAFAALMKLSYGTVTIKSRKSQWGSCDSNGNLTFSWRLMMAVPECVDYVVVHELCHRKHMNHSKAFWKSVELILPDYKEREAWLKENNINMVL